MKRFKFLLSSFVALLTLFAMTGCYGHENPDPDPVEPDLQDYHFDLWVALDRHGGMGRDVQTLVRSVATLDAGQAEIAFQGTGTEVNSILSLETIVKGAYYYQVPVSGDRFAKYTITDNRVKAVRERRFQTNTFATRKYTHAWIGEDTLVIMAANGDGDKIVWTKLDAGDLHIIAEGTLDISMPEGSELFTTSGILSYRASDDKLFYFYYAKSGGARGKRMTPMMTAVIDPFTMAVESNSACFLNCEMVGSAYGELLQTTTFIDDEDNLYVACFTDDADGEHSHLLKIPAGSDTFDPGYDGFTADGKLISVMYAGGSKVVAYAREDKIGTNIDDFSHYYTVIDLVNRTSTPIACGGERLAYSSGRFSSRMACVNQKAYIGVDAEGRKPQIYIYDLASGQTTLGATMAPGYYFEQIRVVENLAE